MPAKRGKRAAPKAAAEKVNKNAEPSEEPKKRGRNKKVQPDSEVPEEQNVETKVAAVVDDDEPAPKKARMAKKKENKNGEAAQPDVKDTPKKRGRGSKQEAVQKTKVASKAKPKGEKVSPRAAVGRGRPKRSAKGRKSNA